MMTYAKIKPTKRSDVIEKRIESIILEGAIKLGEKLPAERALARQFAVSRPRCERIRDSFDVIGKARQGAQLALEIKDFVGFYLAVIKISEEQYLAYSL